MENLYDPNENVYILVPNTKHKDNTNALAKTETKTKTETKAKTKSPDKSKEGVYDPDEDGYILKHKDNNKSETELKAKVPCWVCGKNFLNIIGRQTHMNKHWRENIATTGD